MVFHNWSTVVRNWFSHGAQTKTVSRATLRRRKQQVPHATQLECLEERLVLSAIVVTGTGDAVVADGVVTLREAIISMNNGANVDADVTAVGTYGVNDTITFNIPGVGVQTISPATPLPTVLKPVTIDGYSQPEANANTSVTGDDAVLLIQVTGTNPAAGANGLVLGAGSGGSSVSGLIINRFTGTQILVQSSGNTITGNFLGTNASGTAGVSITGGFGVEIDAGLNNTIGGTTPAARNVIGGNSDGINLNTGSQNNVIQGNFIGVGADGTTAVGNQFHGIALRGNGGLGVQNNQIGGTVAGAGNTIANNGAAGVAVFGDASVNPQNSGNAILGNSIYNNGLLSPATRLGIDLVGTGSYPADDGVTANDPIDGDGDSGPNLLQNYPVLTSTTSDTVSTTIVGTLNSRANTLYRIEFFSSSATSGTGHGEGETFLGFTNVTTNAAGNVHFNTTLMTPVSNGRYISATATSVETISTPAPTSPAGVLGTASTFAILAGGAVSATLTDVTGDIGLFPAAAVTATGNNSGTIHNGDAVAAQAQADLTVAYNFLGAQPITMQMAGDLAGLTLTPGVYHFTAAATLSGILTLDTQGDPDAFFVFQFDAAFAAAAASSVVFLNGPTDSLYWKGAAAFGLGADAHFLGNIVGNVAITMGAGATLDNGRALSRGGAVTTSGGFVDLTSTIPPSPSTPNNTSEFSTSLLVPTVSVAPIITATTFIIVTGTGDTVAFDGVVTLREAMISINNGANVNADVMAYGVYGVNDTISFNIPGTGVQTISPATPLPTLVKPVAIDGYTQPGTSANALVTSDNAVLLIQLDGTSAGPGANGLVFGAGSGGSSVSGLVVNRFSGTQILVQSSGNTISGNFLGTNAAGTAGVSITGGFGVGIDGGSNNTIGGTTPAARNVIGGNSDGINLNTGSQSNVIQGNYIGVGADGTTAVGNRFHGIALRGNGGLGVQNNQIGGTVAGAGNTIANSGSAGVAVFGDASVNPQNSGNAILGNSIYNNGLLSPATRLGIDLVGTGAYPADDGVTPNDPIDGDGDSGPNLLQNFPILSSANSDSVSTTIVGTLNSRANTLYRIEFFSNSTASGSGHGEGQTFIGFTDVTTGDTGSASFNATLMTPVSNGRFITATATSVETTSTPAPTSPAGVLGTASTFAILAGGAVSATLTDVTGDIGLFPAAAVTATGNNSGTIHNGDAVAAQAQADLTVAYNFLGAQPITMQMAGDLAGLTLTPGVYHFTAAATLSGILTLDTQGDPDAFFVFQFDAAFAAAAASSVVFLNGPTDSLYWRGAAAFGLGADAHFQGNIVGNVAITMGAGATLDNGRALSRGGAVTTSGGFVDLTSTIPPSPSTPNNTSEFSAVRLNVSSVILPSVTLGVSPPTRAEGAGTTTVTATLSATSLDPIIVALAFTGTAANGIDYTHVGSQIVIPPGSLSGTLTLLAVQDTLDEANETIIVDISGVTNGTESNSQQVAATIIDDDTTPTLSISDFAVLEGNSGTTNAVFTVTLSAASGQIVTVMATSANGTANSPSDFVALAPTTLTFLPGEITKTVTVAVNGDVLSEANENFIVNLTSATNATIADGLGLNTIINDDPVPPSSPTLSISDFAVLEGNSGTTNAVFTVTLSAISHQTVTVVATSADGTASSSSDYAALAATTLTFLPGETSKTVTIAVNGDLLSESNETLFVNLTGATNATIADGQGLNTIINDDPVPPPSPTLSISDFAVLEGNSGTTNAVFTVTLSAISAQTVTVVATSANGTASSSSDYVALAATTLTFLPGETTKTITVAVNGDVLSEANENFTVNLTGATNATITDGVGLNTIINDDPVSPSSPTLSISDFAVLEGNSGTTNAVFTVTLSAISAQTVTVVATSADGTASSSSDYAALAPTTLTFLPGETTKTVTVAVNGDVVSEANENLTVNLTGATNATIADGLGVNTIINDDPVPPSAPTLSISDFAVLEGNSGTTNAVFTVTLSAISAQTVTVVATSADGTASSSSDYVALAATTLTFLPGETTKTVTVAVNGDVLSEANENFFVNLTSATNATIADGLGLNTIINDDPVPPSSPTLSISDFAMLEGNAGTTNAVFTVTLSTISAQTVTVVATSANGTANSASDYSALATTPLTFLPGEISKTITVAVNGDILSEADETFFVNLTGATNATIADGQGLVTIINDDPVPPSSPTLSVSDVSVVEGNSGTINAVFTVTLSAVSAQTVTVVATSADGTANSATDYLALAPATLTFLPGEISKTVTVAVNGDVTVELDETLFVNLTGATNATVADAQGVGTIVSDDLAPPTSPTLSISDFAVLEGNSGTTNAVFTVTLSAISAQTVTVVATSADGTASSSSDYTALPPTTVTFLHGQLSQTVTVVVNGEVANEANETLFVNLTGATNATIADGQGLLTIINDDPVPPSTPTLSINDFAVLEGNAGTTNAVFTVTLSAISAQTVTVVATSANGTANSPSDYAAFAPTTLTFLPGETSKTVMVAVNGDLVNEANETLFVDLTGATNATIADGQGLLTIINDDPVPPSSPTLSISDFAVLEGNSGTTNAVFTVTLSAVSAQTVTVVAASADGNATTPTDYLSLLPTLLTFAPGVTSQTVSVAVNGDVTIEPNETFFVNLSLATNATVVDGQGLGTIINDDLVPPPNPTLSISDFAVLEGNSGTTNAVFTVTLSAISAQTVTVVATSADGNATTPTDYLALLPTTLTFLPGETTKTVNVAVNGDVTIEPNETLFVNLTGATNATIADGQAVGTIINDDLVPPPNPTLSISDFAVLEGDSGTSSAVFTVTLSAISAQTVTVVATSADATATTPSDYLALLSTTLTFLPGETSKTVSVAVNGDVSVEPNETFFVNLSLATNATVADGQGVGTILDDDLVPPPTPTLSISDFAVLEGNAGTTSAVFTVTLSAISAQAVTVVATSADATATTPSDYLALLPTTLTFLPGETTKTVSVAVNGDVTVEPNETFFVNLTLATNANISDGQGQGTIIDDDLVSPPAPTLSISDVTVLEGDSSTTNAVFTVTLSAISAQTVTVVASTANNTANSPSDYIVLAPTLVTFLPGETSQTVTVSVNGDTVDELNETFFVNLTGATNATVTDGQGIGTITNDETALPANTTPVFVNASPTFSIPENSTVGTVVGTVSATDADLPPQTLTYSIIGGNASGAFAINSATGQITVANSTPLNFEVSPSFTLNVQVTDNGSPTPLTAMAVVVVNLANVGPLITIPNPVGTYQIGNRTPALVAPDSTFTDEDVALPNFSNATLTVSIVAGRSKGDQLKIVKGNSASAIHTKGRKVFAGDVQIGTFVSGGSTRHPNLVVTLNGNATLGAVNNLLHSVNFRARTGGGVTRTLHLQVTNIGGVNSNVASHNMAVTNRS